MNTVNAPGRCERCSGEEWVDVQVGPRHYVSAPCPDCCCPCGRRTGGGLCEACDAESFDLQDAIAVRRADR